MSSKQSADAKKFIEDILSILEIKGSVEVEESQDEEGGNRIKVKIDTEEASVLIGHHGETLTSLQHLVNTSLFKKYGSGNSVLIDIAGYREEKMEKLLEIAENAASKAKFLNKPVALYPMNSYERKAVHEKINQLSGVRSESEGEGSGRRVVIYPAG